MRWPIDRSDDRAWYRQIADDLRSQVEQGVYQHGDVLPSEGDLARHYEVGRNVVRRALTVLRQEGLITGVRGMRTKVRRSARRREVVFRAGDELISRMPTEHERVQHDIDYGVPMLEIKRQDGIVELFAGDQVVVRGRLP